MTIKEVITEHIEGNFIPKKLQPVKNAANTIRMSNSEKDTNLHGIGQIGAARLSENHLRHSDFEYNRKSKCNPGEVLQKRPNGAVKQVAKNNHFSVKNQSRDEYDFKHDINWTKGFYESFEDPPLWTSIMTYLSFLILILVGNIREFLKKFGIGMVKNISEPTIPGFVPLYQSWESFYHWYIFRRGKDTLYRAISSVPGAEMDVLDRVTDDHYWTFRKLSTMLHYATVLRSNISVWRNLFGTWFRVRYCSIRSEPSAWCYTGTTSRVINLGSYNYLGFSQNTGFCADAVEDTLTNLGVGVCASRQELGYLNIHKELDDLVAEYLGVEAAITVPMGFATNSMNMPALMGKDCLILSDELNHASLILGCRLSGAKIQTFRHNCMEDLEMKLKEALVNQQPRTHRKWKKILIVVEGVYSMEGSIVRLPDVVRLKKKYKAYVYLDEAHSIGALGPHGKGVVDYFGMDPKDIDVMMGTFTKSFGAVGGYIGGSKRLIDHLRLHSHSAIYSSTMAPGVVQQVISSMNVILGRDNTSDGINRIRKLEWNTRYFRRRLQKMGCIVYGNKDSPVVPMVTFSPAKVVYFSRECLKNGIGVTVAAFPAVPLEKCRIRFCLSASHTKEMLDKVLDMTDKLGDQLSIKLARCKPANYDNDPQMQEVCHET